MDREHWSAARFVPGERTGHYESWFQRANHPSRPLAFWIRYTIFCPRGRPEDAVGQLWAIAFDAEAERITAVKHELPIAECRFPASGLDVRVGQAELSSVGLTGAAAAGGHRIGWQLAIRGGESPLLLLPRAWYARSLPSAKALVLAPNAVFDGWLEVDGAHVAIDGWRGSLNHNWGSRHTDRYAWGQVAGFDGSPDAFLECSTARVRVGPLWTPWLTLLVLRVDGRELALNSLLGALRATARIDGFTWSFDTRGSGVRVRGRIEAPAGAFVALRYGNPPGGEKICLNSKLARCELSLEETGRPLRSLCSANRAAFEILTDEPAPGVPIVL
ncbi:MAG: hypothetical protein ACHQ3O_00495 [Candidatus Limnocylindria bacterium]